MAKKQEEKKYTAYEAFDFKAQTDFESRHYEKGEEFVLPQHVTRDRAADAFNKSPRTRGRDLPQGLAFVEIGAVISSDPKEKNNPNAERYIYHHILPVKEE